MTHRWQMRRALLAFHEGELTGRKRAALEAHRKRCPACDVALRRLAETDRLLAAARPGTEALSPERAQRVLERALAATGAPRRPARRPALATSGLAAALAVALAAAIGPARSPAPVVKRHPAQVTVVRPPATDDPLAGPGARRRGKPEPATTGGAAQVAAARPEGRSRTGEPSPLRKRHRHKPRRWSAVICRRDALFSPHRFGARRRAGAALPPDEPALASGRERAEIVDSEGFAESEPHPAAQMLVMLTAGHVEDLVTARQAPEETPGYARAAALHPNADGDLIWTQAIVSSAQPGPVLALRTLAAEDRNP